MDLDQPDAGDIMQLAQVISNARESSDIFTSSTPVRKKVSKTSLLLGILGSISLMLLMEITTVIYKNLSSVELGCGNKNATK